MDGAFEALHSAPGYQGGFAGAMRRLKTAVSVVSVPGQLEAITDTVELAKLTLQAICRSDAPAAARAQAARTLLELAGVLRSGGGADTRRTPAEMSLEELDARLEALSASGSGLGPGDGADTEKVRK